MPKNFLFLIILFTIAFDDIHSYIVLPLKLLPKENYKSDNELNSPKDIMTREFFSTFYTEFEIGTPVQKIPMLVKQKQNDYVVTSANPMSNPTRDYSKRDVYNFSPNFLEKYKFYNELESTSISSATCKKRKPYDDDIEEPLAEQMCDSTEEIILYDNVNLNKVTEKNFHFDLVRNIKDNVPGIIGLALTDEYHQVSFLNTLKNNKLINNNYWFFETEKWDSETGKVIFGAFPHEVYEDKYALEDYAYTKNEGSSNFYWEIAFDSITTGDQQFSGESVELNLESNLNIGGKEYNKYFSSKIEGLVNDKVCFSDTFKGYDEYNEFFSDYTFYYCKNDEDTKAKLDEFLKTISFYSKALNYYFELSKEQLLKENGDYIYINIVFANHIDRWKLGKQIALKYKFVFNPETKVIGFYNKTNGDKKDEGKDGQEQGKGEGSGDDSGSGSNVLLIIIIIVIVIVVIVVVIVLVKVFMSKKDNSTEMKDSQYYDNNKDTRIVNDN